MAGQSGSTAFQRVFNRVQAGRYASHDDFRHDFLGALKQELRRRCPDLSGVVGLIVEYRVGRRKRADTRIGNFVIEFDRPPRRPEDVKSGKIEQL